MRGTVIADEAAVVGSGEVVSLIVGPSLFVGSVEGLGHREGVAHVCLQSVLVCHSEL